MPIRRDLRKFYGKKWREEIRPMVRDRAGDKCEHCGRPNGIFGVQCGAAHLNWTPGDDRPENLAWLCRACHLKWDRQRHLANSSNTRKTRKDRARPLLQEAV